MSKRSLTGQSSRPGPASADKLARALGITDDHKEDRRCKQYLGDRRWDLSRPLGALNPTAKRPDCDACNQGPGSCSASNQGYGYGVETPPGAEEITKLVLISLQADSASKTSQSTPDRHNENRYPAHRHACETACRGARTRTLDLDARWRPLQQEPDAECCHQHQDRSRGDQITKDRQLGRLGDLARKRVAAPPRIFQWTMHPVADDPKGNEIEHDRRDDFGEPQLRTQHAGDATPNKPPEHSNT